MQDKAIIFVNTTNLSKPSAHIYRELATMRGLVENGVEVYCILLGAEPTKEILKDDYYKNINFITLGSKNSTHFPNKYLFYLYQNLLIYRVNNVVQDIKKNYKIVVFYTYRTTFFIQYNLYKICKKNRIMIFNEISEYPKLIPEDINIFKKIKVYINYNLYLNYFIPKIEHIFVISTNLKYYFEKHLKKYNKKIPISIFNMMVEPDKYINHSIINNNEFKDIVFAGTLYSDTNGVSYLLEAFLRISNDFPESRLIIIGDNTKPKRMWKIKSITNQIPNPERIIFTGELNRDNVIKWLNAAYCLALARPNNIQAKYGFPTKLGEYLAVGKPVVITAVGDIPIYLKDGENVYLAKPNDVDSFAEKLRECLSDPQRASLIGKNGQKLVYKEFNYFESTKVIVDAF
mgnify:CR=1 FL=1